jgi:hypothetical protein
VAWGRQLFASAIGGGHCRSFRSGQDDKLTLLASFGGGLRQKVFCICGRWRALQILPLRFASVRMTN